MDEAQHQCLNVLNTPSDSSNDSMDLELPDHSMPTLYCHESLDDDDDTSPYDVRPTRRRGAHPKRERTQPFRACTLKPASPPSHQPLFSTAAAAAAGVSNGGIRKQKNTHGHANSVSVACSSCRSRHLRCNETRPCQHCRASGNTCIDRATHGASFTWRVRPVPRNRFSDADMEAAMALMHLLREADQELMPPPPPRTSHHLRLTTYQSHFHLTMPSAPPMQQHPTVASRQ